MESFHEWREGVSQGLDTFTQNTSQIIHTLETSLHLLDLVQAQAEELAQKDTEIERLNTVIYKKHSKSKGRSPIIGFSPTSSKPPSPIQAHGTVIDDVLDQVSDIKLDVEPLHVDIIKWNRVEYATIIGEEQPHVYELLEGGKIGQKIGTWSLNSKQKKKVTMDAKK